VYALDSASALQVEINELSKRLAALEKGKEITEKEEDWMDKISFKGDLRYRFQYVAAENTNGSDMETTKSIQRIRARFGLYADVNNFTTAGIEIRTGEASSGNVTLGNHFDGFAVSISLAYFEIAPKEATYGKVIFGKMKPPWKQTSNLIWDMNPEGIAHSYKKKIKNTTVISTLGYFRVEEKKMHSDLNLGFAQLGFIQPLRENVKLTIGGSIYSYNNAKNFNDPILPGNYAVEYRTLEGFGELEFKNVLPIKLKLYGSCVENTLAPSKHSGFCVGIKLGDAQKGKWEAKYDYRYLGLYATPAYFADSYIANGGTGIRGHRIKAKYNFFKHLSGGVTLMFAKRTAGRTRNKNQRVNTLILDLMVKF